MSTKPFRPSIPPAARLSVIDLGIVLAACAAAFALDAPGGVGLFSIGAGLGFGVVSAGYVYSYRKLKSGQGVAPLPADADFQSHREVLRWQLLLAGALAVFAVANVAVMGMGGVGGRPFQRRT